jgi:hypothetical protein
MLGLACVFALASPVPEAGWTLQPTFGVGERIISLHLGLAHASQSELAVRKLHGKSSGAVRGCVIRWQGFWRVPIL